METDKKVTKRTKRVEHTPILNINTSDVAQIMDGSSIAEIEPIPQETQPQPTQQNPQKPTFTSDNSEVYRTLLLERPGVPFITTIQEATAFVDRYEKWNRKVQLTFKQ